MRDWLGLPGVSRKSGPSRCYIPMDEIFVKTVVERHDEAEEDIFLDGSAKRHRSQVQRLKSSQLGSSPRLHSSAATHSPRAVPELDAPEHPTDQSRTADARKKLPGQRGRGRPPKIPRVEGTPQPAVFTRSRSGRSTRYSISSAHCIPLYSTTIFCDPS